MPDIHIFCVGCGQEFVWSEGEQARFHELGHKNKPKRCRECRKQRRNAIDKANSNGQYEKVWQDGNGKVKAS